MHTSRHHVIASSRMTTSRPKVYKDTLNLNTNIIYTILRELYSKYTTCTFHYFSVGGPYCIYCMYPTKLATDQNASWNKIVFNNVADISTIVCRSIQSMPDGTSCIESTNAKLDNAAVV